MTALPPRSVRNNNPGNLRIGVDWDGLCPRERMTPDQLGETEFCVFVSPAWGFRALALDLRTKWSRDGLTTIRDIITRYAPASENNTEAYIDRVCRLMAFASLQPLDLTKATELQGLCKAIATVEAGGWDGHWRDDDLTTGYFLLPPLTPTLSSPASA